MSDFTELPRAIKDCMKRAGAELSEDQYMLLAGYLAQTQSEVTAAKAESEALRGRISVQNQALQAISNTAVKAPFSHNMKWIFEHCEDGLRGANTESWLLRKQAEAVEALSETFSKWTMDGRYFRGKAKEYGQRLRRQAAEAEKSGGPL